MKNIRFEMDEKEFKTWKILQQALGFSNIEETVLYCAMKFVEIQSAINPLFRIVIGMMVLKKINNNQSEFQRNRQEIEITSKPIGTNLGDKLAVVLKKG